MTGLRQRLHIGIGGCLAGAVALLALAIVAVLIVASVPDRAGLLLSVIAASIPALFYAGVVLRLDRYEIEPPRAVIACFAWGAIGAILLSVAGGLILQAVIAGSLGPETASLLSVIAGAPLIEESVKGVAVLAVLVIARDEFDSVLDGLVYGALVGVGFAMTENILYFGQAYLSGGIGEFGVIVVARAVLGGLGHPAYTAITGAAIGWSREQYGRGLARFVVPVLGWCAAVALHVAWNGGLIFSALLLGDTAGLVETVALQTLIVIVPAVIVLFLIARMSARRELEILRHELRAEVEMGTLTQAEYLTIIDVARRQQALETARGSGGRALRGRQLAFFHTAAELAFRHHHRRQGEPDGPVQIARDREDRQRLTRLRGELSAAGLPPLGTPTAGPERG